MSPLIDSSWKGHWEGWEGGAVGVPGRQTQNRASFFKKKMGDRKRRIDRVEAAEHSEMLGLKEVRVKGEEAFLSSRLV